MYFFVLILCFRFFFCLLRIVGDCLLKAGTKAMQFLRSHECSNDRKYPRKPSSLRTSTTVDRVFSFSSDLTAAVFAGSVWKPSPEIILPRYRSNLLLEQVALGCFQFDTILTQTLQFLLQMFKVIFESITVH